jgi:hypothetical protein
MVVHPCFLRELLRVPRGKKKEEEMRVVGAKLQYIFTGKR